MYTYYFEKMEVWKLSKELVKEIYSLTKEFPKTEEYGLISQLRRAAVSIPTNLAEGSARSTKKDQINFTVISFASLMELLNLLIISFELELMDEKEYNKIRVSINEIANKLNAFRNSQMNK